MSTTLNLGQRLDRESPPPQTKMTEATEVAGDFITVGPAESNKAAQRTGIHELTGAFGNQEICLKEV